jgi:hypothetical protein
MDTANKRDVWDRHNRDEAAARAAQQDAAGPTHKPVAVEAYATSTIEPHSNDAQVNVATLIEEYERATAAEHVAWLAARLQAADPAGVQSWNGWRDSVERTQRAARCLVNYNIARSSSS